MADSPLMRVLKKLPNIAAGGLLWDVLGTLFGIQTATGVIMGAIILWLSHLIGVPIFTSVVISVFSIFLIAFATDCVLDWTGKIRAVKIVFYDSDGKYIQKTPIAYYNEQSNQIVYEVTGYARIVNLGLYSRTLESVQIELQAGNEILDSHLLSQFPLDQRLLSLDSTKLMTISSQLKASSYGLTQEIGTDHSKAKINIKVRATGTLYRKTTKVSFNYKKGKQE